MVNYSSLRVVKIDYSGTEDPEYSDNMPPWFAQMTQLEELALIQGSFPEFPLCLLQLSQLKVLQLADPADPMSDLPESITTLATWPNLTRLNMSGLDRFGIDNGYGLTEESVANIVKLQDALGARSRIFTWKDKQDD